MEKIHDLSTQQQCTGSIPVKVKGLLFMNVCQQPLDARICYLIKYHGSFHTSPFDVVNWSKRNRDLPTQQRAIKSIRMNLEAHSLKMPALGFIFISGVSR